jgi:hypothetical protein
MASLLARARHVWDFLRQSPAQVPARISIPASHVDCPDNIGKTLQSDRDYFRVTVNEIFLARSRQWFTTFDPMALAASEFVYAGDDAIVPFVVGPSLAEKTVGANIPEGMVFKDTRVAGPHPYRGGGIALTMVLYGMPRSNYARQLLELVESTAGALDFAVPLSSYTKLAGVVLDGVEAVLGIDGAAKPIVGERKQLDPVQTGYFALVDCPETTIDAHQLWVRDNELVFGADLESAQPLRQVRERENNPADYVLYSITSSERDDVSKLPFFETWQRIVREAERSSKADIWESAKANMTTLLEMLHTSPDLTSPHAARLAKEYLDDMVATHEQAVRLAKLGGATAQEPSDIDDIRAQAVAVLRL